MNISGGSFFWGGEWVRKERGQKMEAFKLLPLQFRRWEWVCWIMDLFIGLEKKEEQQSWYQSGLKPLDLWGFSAVVGGLFESAIYQLRSNQNQALRGLLLSHVKPDIRIQSTWLVKAWLIKKKKRKPAAASRICLQITADGGGYPTMLGLKVGFLQQMQKHIHLLYRGSDHLEENLSPQTLIRQTDQSGGRISLKTHLHPEKKIWSSFPNRLLKRFEAKSTTSIPMKLGKCVKCFK